MILEDVHQYEYERALVSCRSDEMESQALESALLRRAREAQVEAEMLKVKASVGYIWGRYKKV